MTIFHLAVARPPAISTNGERFSLDLQQMVAPSSADTHMDFMRIGKFQCEWTFGVRRNCSKGPTLNVTTGEWSLDGTVAVVVVVNDDAVKLEEDVSKNIFQMNSLVSGGRTNDRVQSLEELECSVASRSDNESSFGRRRYF